MFVAAVTISLDYSAIKMMTLMMMMMMIMVILSDNTMSFIMLTG